MNCTNCGKKRQTKSVLTSCEMTGSLIKVNMGYCPCEDKDVEKEKPLKTWGDVDRYMKSLGYKLC